MFTRVSVAALALAVVPASQSIADVFPRQCAFFSRPLILVQHSPEYCRDGCERKYNFCVHAVNDVYMSDQVRQMALDKCELNYHVCVKNCS